MKKRMELFHIRFEIREWLSFESIIVGSSEEGFFQNEFSIKIKDYLMKKFLVFHRS